MAKLLAFSVLDSKVGTFSKPFFMRTRGEALRSWQEVSNDPQTEICKYSQDFSLMEVGTYEEETGRFENLTAPSNLGLAVTFKRDVPALSAVGSNASN